MHRIPVADVPVREGGWALACDTGPPIAESGPGWSRVRRAADGLTSTVVGLYGWGEADGTVVAAEDTNACGRYSATPVLEGTGALLVTLVALGTDVPVTGAAAALTPGGTVEIRFPDGTRLSAGPASPPGPGPAERS